MSENKLSIPNIPQEQNYVIAYIDILGIRDKIAHQDDKQVFKDIYYPFLLADRVMPQVELFEAQDIKVKIFSDNILFAYPVKDSFDKEDVYLSYRKLVDYLGFFLHSIANKGILFRGAIAFDKLMINDLLVWGEGLLKVVYLEENVAIYPRIILSEELLKIFDEFSLSGIKYEQKFSCLKDFDDCVFFNFFDYEDTEATESLLYYAKKYIRENIEKERAEKNRPKILHNYYWFENYLVEVEKEYTTIRTNLEQENHKC